MRRLKIALVVLPLLWVGCWIAAAQLSQYAAARWFEARDGGGAVAQHSGLGVSGFPARLDMTITGLRLLDPRRDIGWSAPSMRAGIAAYRPDRITLRWPDTQTMHLPAQTLELASGEMHATARLRPLAALGLDTATMTLGAVELNSDRGWSAALDSARIDLMRADADGRMHDLRLTARRVAPAARLFGAAAAPDPIDRIGLDARLGFVRPLDRHLAGGPPPRLDSLVVREARIAWGAMTLRAEGAVTFDADGMAEGELTLQAENWREMLELAAAAGLLPAERAPLVARALEALDRRSAGEDSIEVPLTLAGGMIRLGVLPLGPIPGL